MSDELKMRPAEITAIIKKELEQFENRNVETEAGRVLTTGDGIARVYGLDRVMSNELLEFPHNIFGLALSLERENVGCILLGDNKLIKEGDLVKSTGRIMEVPVGPELIGRVVDALGQPIDGKGLIPTKKTKPVEGRAPSVTDRQPVCEPLHTGLKAVDSMVPIGRGQRELIIGDRQTGKTALAVDAIINQKDTGVICIYVAIGQKQSTVARMIKTLESFDSMKYTIVMDASASDPTSLQYLAPYSGCAMAEEFSENGKHVLIIYDDLSKHAVAYREISLLLRRPPAREAYPGDIFYLHSRLLERSAKFSNEKGGGSMTALPIIETQAGDISAYIPTNVISITDGQIYLETSSFNAGIRPAINAGLSVSRVGGKAQTKAMKQVAGRLRLDLTQARELAAFTQFGSEMDKTSWDIIVRGDRLVEILKQDQYKPLPVEQQVVIIFAAVQHFLDDIPLEKICSFETGLYAYMDANQEDLMRQLKTELAFTPELEEKLRAAIISYKEQFKA